jgi:hypothetical protein
MKHSNQNVSIPTYFVKLHSNIISGATDGLVYARNGPLQQVALADMGS